MSNFKIEVEPGVHRVSRDASEHVYGMRKFSADFKFVIPAILWYLLAI